MMHHEALGDGAKRSLVGIITTLQPATTLPTFETFLKKNSTFTWPH